MSVRSAPPAILVADAEPYICRIFEAKLTKNNQFQVDCVTTGVDAIAAAEARNFDVLLWDMRLRNTPELLPRLRAICPGAALLVMTTDDRPILGAEFERLHVAQALTKPFGLDTLVERVEAALALPPQRSASARVELTEIGQQIALVSADGECVTRTLFSTQDTFGAVAAPRVFAPAAFAPGLQVEAQVLGPDALYRFDTEILEYRAALVPCWILQRPRFILRDQRRRFARLPLRIQAVVTERVALSEAPTAWQGAVDDVSLGGCALISEQDAPPGTRVSIGLRATGQAILDGAGRVVRSQSLQSDGSDAGLPRYRIAIEFTELESAARAQLAALLETSV